MKYNINFNSKFDFLSLFSKKTINLLIKIIIASIILLGFTTTVFSGPSINVYLSSQNPDPVAPGNFVYLNAKVTNTGSDSLENANIRIIDNDYLKLAQGEAKVKNLGAIPVSGLDGKEGFVIAKYKVFVTNDAPIGLNSIEFQMNSARSSIIYDFEVLVQDNNPKIQINSFDIKNAEPGKTSRLNIEIENINSVPINDVFLTLDLDSVEGKVLNVKTGSNQKVISTLKGGEKKSISFDLVVDPIAVAKPYLLPVTLTFEDSLNNNYTTKIIGSVGVYSKPILSVKLDSQDVFTGGKTKITLAVANPGTSSIKGTEIEILNSDSYEVIEGTNQYVGDLNPDDFQTVQSTIYINSKEDAKLNVKLSYLDSYNTVQEKVIKLPLKIFTNKELKTYGLATQKATSINYTTLILLVVVGLGSFWFGKRRANKKHKVESK